jgi:hypothetical protein
MLNFMFRFILVLSAAVGGYMLLAAISNIDITTFALATAAEDARQDNTGLWTALIASLTINVLATITGIVNMVLGYKWKVAQLNANRSIEKKIDENTVVTKETKKAINGELDDRIKLEKAKSFKEGYDDHASGTTPFTG